MHASRNYSILKIFHIAPLEDNAGNIITQGVLMAEELNMHFTSVFPREDTSSLPVPETKFNGTEEDMLGQLVVTPEVVATKINNMKDNWSPRVYGRNKCVNYRPVSLTSVICKVLESIIIDHMVDFLSKFKLINPSQHGFLIKNKILPNKFDMLFEEITKWVDEVIYLIRNRFIVTLYTLFVRIE